MTTTVRIAKVNHNFNMIYKLAKYFIIDQGDIDKIILLACSGRRNSEL